MCKSDDDKIDKERVDQIKTAIKVSRLISSLHRQGVTDGRLDSATWMAPKCTIPNQSLGRQSRRARSLEKSSLSRPR